MEHSSDETEVVKMLTVNIPELTVQALLFIENSMSIMCLHILKQDCNITSDKE